MTAPLTESIGKPKLKRRDATGAALDAVAEAVTPRESAAAPAATKRPKLKRYQPR